MSMYIRSVVFTYFLLMCLVFKCHKTVSFLDTKDSKFSLFEKNLMFTFKNDTEFFQTSKFSNNAIINRSSLASYEFVEFFENLLGLQLTGDFLFLPCLWISESPRTQERKLISMSQQTGKINFMNCIWVGAWMEWAEASRYPNSAPSSLCLWHCSVGSLSSYTLE